MSNAKVNFKVAIYRNMNEFFKVSILQICFGKCKLAIMNIT